MKLSLVIFFTIFLGHISFGQSESEYYKNPLDTIFSSKYFKQQRGITVILPKSFSKSKATKFPLIIVFDRQNKRIFRETFESINYLVSFDEMPEAVIIGISSENNSNRFFETSFIASTEKAQGEKLINFLYQELIPWAESELNCSKTKLFIGHSRFGYFTSYLLSNKIDDLTGIISCSPFFIQPNINVVDSLKSRLEINKLKHTVYYRFVTGDSLTDTNDYSIMNLYLKQTKVNPYFDWKGIEFYDAKHFAVPGLGVMPSLLEIFDFWSDQMNLVLQEHNKVFSPQEYEIFLQKMQNHYGDKIGLGLSVINGIGYKYYNEKQYSKARQSWDILLKEYPMFTSAYIQMGNTYLKEGNKSEALNFYKKAKQMLQENIFYSNEEKKDLLTDIQESITSLRQ